MGSHEIEATDAVFMNKAVRLPETPGEWRRVNALLAAARAEFGEEIMGPARWADRAVIVAVGLAEEADFERAPGQAPALGVLWSAAFDQERRHPDHGSNRPRLAAIVQAQTIRWLIGDPIALSLGNHTGVHIQFAKIEGIVDLSEVVADKSVGFWRCDVDALRILGARLQSVSLNGSVIHGRAHHNMGVVAILADGVVLARSMDLRNGFRANGEVRLLGAVISGNLDCTRASFVCSSGDALNADGAVIAGSVIIRWLGVVRGAFDFTRAKAGYLTDGMPMDDPERPGIHWPDRLRLTAFEYEAIHYQSPLDAMSRLKWLERHDRTNEKDPGSKYFNPQPYRQLAEVLRKQGHERDAAEIMRVCWCRRARLEIDQHCERVRASRWVQAHPRIAGLVGRADRGVRTGLKAIGRRVGWAFGWWRQHLHPWWLVFWRRVANAVVGHGYDRWRALWWIAALWLVGFVVFGRDDGYWMQPSQAIAMREIESARMHEAAAGGDGGVLAGNYPRFRPVMYSLDVLLPLVEFDQGAYWRPRTDPDPERWWIVSGYRWTRFYLALHIAAGWVLATLFAASFTRIMRSE